MLVPKPLLYLGFDPGSHKCGLAVVDSRSQMLWRGIEGVETTLERVEEIFLANDLAGIVIGDQTQSQYWQDQIRNALKTLPLHVVREDHSSEQARIRYWDYYPAGWQALLPKGLRVPPTPYDDLVALILVERFLAQKVL